MGLNPEPDQLVGWTPTRIECVEGRPQVEWWFTQGIRFTDPFFGQTIDRCARFPLRLLFHHRSTMEHLARVARDDPGLEPSGFIFHGSRCGSTLVAQMCSALAQTLVMSEPPPLHDILETKRRCGHVADRDHQDWMRWVISALGRPQDEERHFVVKFDAWSVIDLPFIRRTFPTTPWIFVYRDPVEVVQSHLGHRGYHMVPGSLSAEQLAMSSEESGALEPEEYCAAVLGRLYECALQGTTDGSGLLIDYRELPDAVITRIAPHFGLACGPDQRRIMGAVARRDAKNPFIDFAPKSADQRRRASDFLRSAVQRRVVPHYLALQDLATHGSGTP